MYENVVWVLFSYESNSGGEREIQRTMLELLNQLDGFDSRGDVKVKKLFFFTKKIDELSRLLWQQIELIVLIQH